jgi:hypothetical protein
MPVTPPVPTASSSGSCVQHHYRTPQAQAQALITGRVPTDVTHKVTYQHPVGHIPPNLHPVKVPGQPYFTPLVSPRKRRNLHRIPSTTTNSVKTKKFSLSRSSSTSVLTPVISFSGEAKRHMSTCTSRMALPKTNALPPSCVHMR